jgi:hypothetical protein
MAAHGRDRRRRTITPYRVDRIAIHRDQFAAGALAGLRQAFHRIGRMQPGIVAEPAVARQMFLDPSGRRLVDQMQGREDFGVDLFGRLQRIAAVDENRGAIHQNHGNAGGTRKAGEPKQPFGAGGHIFILVFIGAWNHKSIKAAALQFFAQRRGAFTSAPRIANRRERLVPALEHDSSRLPSRHGR